LRCRLGLHHWQTHRIADGLGVSKERIRALRAGVTAWPEDPGPRIDPRDIPPGGS